MRFDKCILFWLCHLILLICIDFCFRFSRINIQRIVSYFIAGVTFTELIVKTKRHNCKYAVITFIIILSALGDSGVFKTSRYQGIVKATVSWVFEDLKFRISEGSDQNWDSQLGRIRTISVLVRAFWNSKLKVLKHSRKMCSSQYLDTKLGETLNLHT